VKGGLAIPKRRGSDFEIRALGRIGNAIRLGGRKVGGFWGEQPGAGGTAHFGTVARPTDYYGFWKAKFADFFRPGTVALDA
jgi:hypothetical protein